MTGRRGRCEALRIKHLRLKTLQLHSSSCICFDIVWFNIVFKKQFTTTCKFALENNKHKKLKTTKTHVEKTCAKLACGPNNFKNTKPMEIETCSPLHKILIRLWKFNIDRTNHHICWSQPPPKSVFRGSTMFQCLTL